MEICELIGAGATGEVYRARDTVLDRDVAVKILSEPYASGDHLVRFEREARILASLNHPNIAQVYGLQRTDGVPALVMELVSGHTLSDVSTGDASSLKHRLETAQQIAGALDAAHERGVIHKDLKPSNIKVRPDGTVKILDFGLAKTIDPPGLSPHDCPAADEPLTRTGTILGTVAYMSPEQARGLAADRRSDLWALGVVLTELLAGRALFQRGTTADTLAAVLTAEPDWRALPSELPEGSAS
ncbi:MAG: serine/threonine-protein kinase [Vicinamibacterales bacterium]